MTDFTYPVKAPVRVGEKIPIPGNDRLRDACSPEQLRAIFGEQGEALIRRE